MNDSGRHVRNFYITFVLISVYIVLIVWSTTDEMLLRISPVTLPILKLQVPIKGFYTFIPYLFLLVHFNLLLQLHLLANKLAQFNQQLDILQINDAEHLRIRLFPFPFVQMLSAKHQSKWTQALLILMVWILIIILPPVVLILLQLGFLPFHDSDILCGQRIAVTLDSLCLLLFFPMMYKHGTKRWLCYGQGVLLFCMSGVFLIFSWGLATLPDEAKQQVWAEWLPLSFWSEDKGKENDLKWTVKLFDEKHTLLHRNLDLSEKLLIANTIRPFEEQQLRRELSELLILQPIIDNIQGLNLKGRDLREANLEKVILVNSDLREARLHGTILWKATLQGSNLSSTRLQGANLSSARLQGTDLHSANLQGASLRNAKLQGASFRGAHLTLVNIQDVVIGNFTQKDYSQIKISLEEGSLSQKKQERILKRLQKRVGRYTQIDDTTIGNNTFTSTYPKSKVSNAILNAKNLSLVKSEQDYMNDLSAFLTNLACSDSIIAQGIIRYRATSWFGTGGLISKTIATTLLVRKNDTSRQCAGLANLDSELLKMLEKSTNKYNMVNPSIFDRF